MDFEEYACKPLLQKQGIKVPISKIAYDKGSAEAAAKEIGPCVIKAQVPTGKRGKAGGIKLAETPEQAREHANEIIGMTIDGWAVEKVLIESQMPIKHEFYAAILNDHTNKNPMVLFSIYGGMDVEEVTEKDPDAMQYIPVSIVNGLQKPDVENTLKKLDLGPVGEKVTETLMKLYDVYRANDAELVEINPLVITQDDQVIALDCKFTLDDSAVPRQGELAKMGATERRTELEARAAEIDLKYIDLDGSCRSFSQWGRIDDDDNGCDCTLWRQTGQFYGNRRGSL